ncbi:bifunctional heparan sulfate N-deacetylase/N-sulfotransferase 4-like [Montipora capricornis]|uniref:bifunctional heparan sulfate N-deacetylase/N-sulfotransferase 4-like n=1 Tax=Montipora capricornis TaxID=246305 RepID=UPI0035F152AC
MRFFRLRTGSLLRRFMIGLLILSVTSCWLLVYHDSRESTNGKRAPVLTEEKCYHPRRTARPRAGLRRFPETGFNSSLKVEKTVLVAYRQTSITFRAEIATVLEANRVSHRFVYLEPGDKTVFPEMTSDGVGKFSVVIFESIKFYLSVGRANKKFIDNYCRKFAVGIILFTEQEVYQPDTHLLKEFHLSIKTGLNNLQNVELNPSACLLRLTRAGGVVDKPPNLKWSVFFPNHSTYEAVEFATQEVTISTATPTNQVPEEVNFDVAISHEKGFSARYATVLTDIGGLDGIKRVYFGSGLSFWLHKLLFLDALAFVSRGLFAQSLERRFVVDIDDIFVGRTGIRITKEDVKAMISVQRKLQERVPGFHFNLGFSGGYFLHGSDEENEGDLELVKNADKFWWFSHMWLHMKAHQMTTLQELMEDLKMNLEFAKQHNIPVNTTYAVPPHHSGVYPPHDLLYEGWKKVYNLKVTSTEEYPHLHPDRFRRGFIYKNVKVLPRQTCGLFTHTLFLRDYPKGQQKLENSIHGGELFQVVVNNPISIFMTHLSNYGNDRLALLVFDSLTKYLLCWTNLKLSSEHPTDLAERYFNMYPDEEDPVWQNPCLDPRHKSIWNEAKNCRKLPSFLVVGPQKTGTTALHTFLKMHPDILSSEPSVTTFEEVQFFNGHNYNRGLDWYMDFFRDIGNSSFTLLFEKSANYFDSKVTPMRAHALLPNAKIIMILIDPARRAYSWYQHMKSHGVSAAQIPFHKVLTSTHSTDGKDVIALGQRCLIPGLYVQHLERWLMYFSPSQILILDGEKLRTQPAEVMSEVQRFLGVTVYDYNKRLRFDKHKGFYCQITSQGGNQCLGKGKGRQYAPIDGKSRQFLEEYYKKPNKDLADLLRFFRRPQPSWLRPNK